MCDTDTEQGSDVEDVTSASESLSHSQLDTSADTSAADAKPTPEAQSPVTVSVDSPAPKVASPVQQVI